MQHPDQVPPNSIGSSCMTHTLHKRSSSPHPKLGQSSLQNPQVPPTSKHHSCKGVATGPRGALGCPKALAAAIAEGLRLLLLRLVGLRRVSKGVTK